MYNLFTIINLINEKKLIKLTNTHYIIVDDSDIKEGDWIDYSNLTMRVPVKYLGGDLIGTERKITHSTEPIDGDGTGACFIDVKQLDLTEIEKLINSYVFEQTFGYSVDRLAESYAKNQCGDFYNKLCITGTTWGWETALDYRNGFKVCLELMKDKLFTIEDMQQLCRRKKLCA